jgi:hypothetical protein
LVRSGSCNDPAINRNQFSERLVRVSSGRSD